MEEQSKRPTVRDVARQAGLSVASVSRALASPDAVRPRTKELVFAAVQETGYRRNQTAAELRTGRSKTLLVLVSEITNAFFSEFFKGIEEEARANGYVLLIGDISEAAENDLAFSEILSRNQAAGLILNTFGFLDDLLPKEAGLTYNGPPLVSCNGCCRIPVPAVRIDDERGGESVAEHLIGLGHTDMIQVAGKQSVKVFERRCRGFAKAMREAGIEARDDVRIEGQLSTEFGLNATRTILGMPRLPTAVFAHNDETAIGLLHGLTSNGLRVPHDISVVGYDDMPYAAVFNPGLTTVRLPRREWGRKACRKLISVLDGSADFEESEIIQPELISRASSGHAGHIGSTMRRK